MSKSWYAVEASEDGKTANVSVRGYIGDWGVNDQQFIADVEAHGEVDTINVSINSRGGQIDHAVSIFNYLKNHPAQVNMHIDGVAMSAATIIMMAGDSIEAPANAVIMMHKPLDILFGYYNADTLRKKADVLDVFQTALMETYKSRTGKSDADLNAIMDAETFMTAKEAKKEGFIDKVIPLKAKASAHSAMAYAAALDIPAEVMARAEAEGEESAETEENTEGPLQIIESDNVAYSFRGPKGMTPARAVDYFKAMAVLPTTAMTAQAIADGWRLEGVDEKSAKHKTPAQPAITFADQIKTAAEAAGLGHLAAWFAVDAGLADMNAVNAALAEARELRDLCGIVNMPDMAEPMIKQRKPLAEARAALQTKLAEQDEALHASNLKKPDASGSGNVSPALASATSIWESRRAGHA